jgi:hypothetical protein
MRVGVQVKVPASLDRLPETLARRQPVFLKKLADGVAEEIATQAPGGPAGKIGRSWRGELLSADEAQVVSSQPGAKALDVGAYIHPRHAGRGNRRPVIKFDGVYRPYARIPARHYVRKALARRRRRIDAAFSATYHDLG